VVNHAEFVWAPFTKLCMELRQRLLHVYTNTYVTPPASQAVPPHADDRDVFILQLCGRKHWRVFASPPIKFPYTDEQVGKNLGIPDEVFSRPPAIECVLEPGDVLYMPRGWVHEAWCQGGGSSWHATLAVATHDWSWSKVLSATLAAALDEEASARWRAAVPLGLGLKNGKGTEHVYGDLEAVAHAELEELGKFMKEAVTVPKLREAFSGKLVVHNDNQEGAADFFQTNLQRVLDGDESVPCLDGWPEWRSSDVRHDSKIKRTTPDERKAFNEWATQRRRQMCSKGKGKGKGSLMGVEEVGVRTELTEAVDAAFGKLSACSEAGLKVQDLAETDAGSRVLDVFDELTLLCLARVWFSTGELRLSYPHDEGNAVQDNAPAAVSGFLRKMIGRWTN